MKSKLSVTTTLACLAIAPAGQTLAKDWPMFGRTIDNTSDSAGETHISSRTVARLKPKWTATIGGDVSARAAVVDGVVYFPDWGGNIWALKAVDGTVVWHHHMRDYGLGDKTVSRSSPAVARETVYVGTQTGADLLAVNAITGKLRWKTTLDDHPQAIVTGSAAVHNGVVYVGVASHEEAAAGSPTYPCCSFRGSVVALDADTGKILWKTFTTPAGYSGAAVWGSNPVIDPKRNALFIGTGDNYTLPNAPSYISCIKDGGTEAKCLSPNNHVDAVISLDIATGKFNWSTSLRAKDDWNVSCYSNAPGEANCPKGAGPDYDFGSAPNRFTIPAAPGGTAKTVVGAGQKSGVYTVFDADTGDVVWSRKVGPGSTVGGIEWGTATDGARIYVAISNYSREKYAGGTSGSWSALDARTGDVLWRVPDPNDMVDLGPMAVANGVVFAGSTGFGPGKANMFALDGHTGKVLWKFNSQGSVISGATIVDGVVYWGSGYSNFGPVFKGAKRFYAFSIDGK